MTFPTGRRLYVAGGVAALVLIAVVSAMRDDEPTSPSTQPRTGRTQGTTGGRGAVAVDDVKLELLKMERPELADAERNPFRFRPPPAPAPPPSRAAVERPVPVAPPVPAGPPSPPPIPLRYIGLMDAPTQSLRVAVLSDGRGNVFYGKEGDIIEGRYRVVRIGSDAAELAHVDGRGRQTIRLSGQ